MVTVVLTTIICHDAMIMFTIKFVLTTILSFNGQDDVVDGDHV